MVVSNVPAEVLRVAEARRATVAPPPKIRFRYRRADLHIGQQVSAGRLTAKGASLLRRRGYVTVGRWSFEAQGDRGLWECLQQGFTWHQVQRKLAVSVEQSGVTGPPPGRGPGWRTRIPACRRRQSPNSCRWVLRSSSARRSLPVRRVRF